MKIELLRQLKCACKKYKYFVSKYTGAIHKPAST